ncbi:MAG: choice-of-anchor H family protein [Gammaproteobacteria bacterium]|nr:choice-of-anchor H family protein [Gammaproteobacteria bacterium]
MNYLKRTINIVLALPLVLLLTTSHTAMAAEEDARISTTSQGLASQRGTTAPSEPSRDEYEALKLSGDRNKTARAKVQQKTSGIDAHTPNTDFWFYTTDVELFTDRDRDGYYAGIDLLFDADTYYDVADVYAVIYLSYEYGPWNEYAETDDFTIFGTSGDDEYIVETDLVAGYPTGNYDILIELYDAYDNSFLADIGPEDTSELSILPLEDSNRDAPATVTTQVVVSHGGGGSLSWFLLLGLAGAGALARKD